MTRERTPLQRGLVAVLLLAPAVIVFAPALHYPFVDIDDTYYVVQNPAIRDWSWRGLWHLFCCDVRDLRWFPVSYVSFALDHRLFGLDAHAFHRTSLLFHLANVLLVARLVERVFRDRALGLGTALLFAIHPLQVESVAWVMSRKNVVFLCFFLLSALVYLRARDMGAARRGARVALLCTSALLYFVACMAKTAALPLPALLVAIDLAREPRPRPRPVAFLRRTIPSKLPFLLPALVDVVISLRYAPPNPFRTDFGFGAGEWATIVGHNFFFYVEKTFAPFGLAPFYPLPPAGALPAHFALYAGLSIALVGLGLWALARERAPLMLGLAWYGLTIAPNTLYAVIFSDLPILVADRYAYQALPGLLLPVVAGVVALARARPRWRPALATASLAIVVALGVLASAHRASWRSSLALYERVVAVSPSDEFFYRIALAHAAAGRQQDAFRALDAAVSAPRQIFYTDFLYYRLELAALWLRRGDAARAADQLEAGIAATPNDFEPDDARVPLAFLWLGALRERAGDAEAAARARERALAAREDPSFYFETTWMRISPDESRRFVESLLAASPEDGRVWLWYGLSAQAARDERTAEQRFARAAALGYRPPAVAPLAPPGPERRGP